MEIAFILFLHNVKLTLYSESMKLFLYSILYGVCASMLCLITNPFSVHSALATSYQSNEEGIIVIVNDSIITHSDFKDRLQLIMQSSGMSNTPEIRQKLAPQITDTLVEEQLKLQEASALGIEVTDEQVQEGLSRIAVQNNIPVTDFVQMLVGSGLNIQTLHNQIRAEISWGSVIARKVRPQINVTETDVDVELARLEKSVGHAQYLLSEIFLNVGAPEEDLLVRERVQKLYQQIQKKPESFSALARQFSQAAGASQGGNMGWVETGQSEKIVEDVLSQASKGTITSPIRTKNGYHIFLLRDKRILAKEAIPDREEILSRIGQKRLVRQATSYLLDLKSNAFIEYRDFY